MRRNAPVAIAAALIVLAASGCSGEPASPPVNTPTAVATESATPTPTPTPEATAGSRQAPLALGETRQLAADSAWIVGITAVSYDASAAVAAENSYADPAPAGSTFVVPTLQIAMHEESMRAQPGDIESQGIEPWANLKLEYVYADGTSIDEVSSDVCIVEDMIFEQGAVFGYEVVTTGNYCFVMPVEKLPGGTWRVSNTRGDSVWIEGAP